MLVLTRKKQQSVRIGENITISVLKVKGNTVRLGIEAPDQIRVLRSEIPLFDTSGEGDDSETSADECQAPSGSESVEAAEAEADVAFPPCPPINLVL